jgi:uncharacterized lipoprotein YmbA
MKIPSVVPSSPFHPRSLLLPLLAACLLPSCGVLDPVEDRSVNHILEAAAPARTVTGNAPVIAIARPTIPGYLDRQQLVTRDANAQLVINLNELWAEPLDDGIARVTAENLALIKNSLNIQPIRAFIAIDYSHLLETRITRFDADAATRTVVLECTWRLQPVSGRLASARPFRAEIPIADTQFSPTAPQNARVAAMNQALAQLAAAIAREL